MLFFSFSPPSSLISCRTKSRYLHSNLWCAIRHVLQKFFWVELKGEKMWESKGLEPWWLIINMASASPWMDAWKDPVADVCTYSRFSQLSFEYLLFESEWNDGIVENEVWKVSGNSSFFLSFFCRWNLHNNDSQKKCNSFLALHWLYLKKKVSLWIYHLISVLS